MSKKVKEKPTKTDYENIGRSIEAVVMYGYGSKRRLMLANFVRGAFFGMGSALGATVFLAIVLFILSLFTEVPLVGRFFENLQNTLESTR